MKTKFFRFVSLSVLTLLSVAFLPVPGPAAQASVMSVSPDSIVNNKSNTITVEGSGFDATAVVLMDGTSLATTFGDEQTLTAVVPAGVAVGSYKITVTVSGVTVTGFAMLQVTAPPTPVPTATTAPAPFARPQFVVHSTKVLNNVQKGKDFTLKVVVENLGQAPAYSAQAVFASSDLVPTKTGGVVAIGTVPFDQEVDFSQTFYVTGETTSNTVFVVDMNITYYDDQGTTYSDKFTLSIPVKGTSASSGGVAYPTATPTNVKSSQLVITGYSASVDPLQPGEQFSLKMTVKNVGNANAQRVTMIVGGGSSGGSDNGTPQPGGVSGGSGEFTNFAPVSASNIQSLGDLKAGDAVDAVQQLIVNVSTNPGAYPMKVTFSYLNDKNEVINDEQVITLLVYSLPSVDISFYRPLDPFFVGQPGPLPIQVVNLGKRLSVLGNMKVEAQGGTVDNGSSLIGSLDAGGYYTLDPMLTPNQSGTLDLNVTIEYVDDFNQPRTITRTLQVEVQEAMAEPTFDPSMNGGGGGEFPTPGGETSLQKVWRFILGLFGLDSSAPTDSGSGVPPAIEEQPIPVKPIPGKG